MYKLTSPPNKKDHFQGSLTSQLVLVEYGDYQCPHSTKANLWIKKLQKEFTHELCYVYRHFPLNDIHPQAVLAAIFAEAASFKKKFWQMHELLFTREKNLSLENDIDLVTRLGLNKDDILLNLNRRELIDKVSMDIMTGEQSGVISTPAFFINSIRMEGPISYEILRENLMKTLDGHILSA